MTKTTDTKSSSYLMWVGADNYPTIEDWTEEVERQGVSKRLPGMATGEALVDERSVVFVAHDEGEYKDCPECIAEIECGECRKAKVEADRLDQIRAGYKKELEVTTEDKLLRRLRRKITTIDQKISKLDAHRNGDCEICQGTGSHKAGSGGQVKVDGESWDYRRYNYHLHHGALADKETRECRVTDKCMCEKCGGTGRLPEGKVFGMFVPDAIEYLVKSTDDQAKIDAMGEKFRLIEMSAAGEETKRRCGTRKEGGVYAATSATSGGLGTKRAIRDMVEQGLIRPEAVEIKGGFAAFITPISIDDKRFRGIKRWSFDDSAAADAEIEMILDALEG